ncbi:MAG: CpsB/CapC family capsule biosynthesis tyrosine phosphatase, partial [Roseiflexaceae bacterium]
MIDIHCHILHGLDDGARSFDVSFNMARQAAQAGVKTLV